METGSAPTTGERAEESGVVSRNVPGAHEEGSGREMDRTDPEEARAVVERIVPDEAARRACLALLADAIETAHETAPASWSVTLFRDGVRLNVGAVETTVIGRKRRGTIYLLVDGRSLEAGAQAPARDGEIEWNEVQVYASFPGARGIFIQLDAAGRVLPAWRKANLALVRAAAQARPVGGFRRSHSPAVPEFLGLTLGRDLPLEPEVQEEGASSLSQSERETRQAELVELLREFAPTLQTERGQKHVRFYTEQRRRGRENWEAINAAEARGEDVTEAVLMKLLPHANTAGNRERGAWVTITPAITKDLKQWFDASGTPRDWPAVAREVMRFLRTAVADPEKLEEASREFVASPHTKGMQTAFMSPMLNALRPDDFLLINSKPREAINYFAGLRFGNSLEEYAGLNRAGRELIVTAEPVLQEVGGTEARPEDVFDQFTHWLRAEKRFAFGRADRTAEPNREDGGADDDTDRDADEDEVGERPAGEIGYWKIAPGEGAWQWEECRRDGFIGMGWEELGDCGGLSKKEYLKRREETIEAGHDFSRGDMQPWIFANRIKPGDRIVANRGRDEVLGIGTVTGGYEFVPGVRHGHHLPVRWDITEPFAVTRRPWLKTLVRLDQSSFEQILAERAANGNAGEASAFTPRAFELLDGLRQNPTKTYVTEHKDELKSLVEEPFKDLFRRTAKTLPPGILSRMEWEQKCFGRFLKNDYGQGGANPYFWGALYPRGGKRTEDAQLFLWIRADFFGYGFSIGQHGSETSRRFRANLEKHRAELNQLLGPALTELGVVYGGPAELSSQERVQNGLATVSLTEWLQAPERFGFDVRLQMTREEMLNTGEGAVARRIASAFEALFSGGTPGPFLHKENLLLLALASQFGGEVIDHLVDGVATQSRTAIYGVDLKRAAGP